MKLIKLATVVALIATTFAASAKQPTPAEVKKAIPDVEVVYSVKPTPVKGIFEVLSDRNVLYVTEDLRYVFSGHMLDVRHKLSLTDAPMQELQQLEIERSLKEAQNMKGTLKEELQANQKNFIPEVKGNGSKVLYMVTDIRCTFCKRMEGTLEQLTDVTIYRIPVAFLGPESLEKANTAWCSKDRLSAWKQGAQGQAIPAAATCQAPIQSNTALVKKWKVTGTPTLFLADGERWNRGYLALDETKLFMEKGASALMDSLSKK